MAKKIQTLNIGVANISLAEYEEGGKGNLTLARYGTAALAAPFDPESASAVLTPALTELARSSGIHPGKIAVSISGQMVFPKFAAIPMAGGADHFEQMVRYEIEQGIPFPIDEMVCDRQILGDTPSGDKNVMIVAAKVDQIEAITSAVAAAGFSPELVDVAPIALVNAIRFNHPDDDNCFVALDIGAKTTSLVIVEGDHVYTRSIPVAGNAVTKEISVVLGCTLAEAEQAKFERGYVSMGGVTEDADETTEAIAKSCRAVMTRLNAEITRSINFYRSQQQGNPPSRLYLTGGSALLPQIDTFFANELGVEVEFFNPFARIRLGSGVDAAALESGAAFLASTAGLAIHESGAAHFAINLLPPSIVTARAEKARIPFLIVGGAALVLALVLLALGFKNDATVLEAQRDAVMAKLSKLAADDKNVVKAEKDLESVRSQAQGLKDLLASRTASVQRLAAVRTALLPGMWIEKWEPGRITVRYWKDRITAVSGKTIGETVVDKLKTKGVIQADSLRISNMSTLGADGSVEQFTVEVKFK